MTKSNEARVKRRMEKKAKAVMAEVNSDGIKRVLDWAHAPSPYEAGIGRLPEAIVPKANGMTNLQVLGLLTSINGFNPTVTRWGFHQGPFGLTRDEAFLLMQMSSYFQGLMDGANVAAESGTNMLRPLCEYWASKWEATEPPADVDAPAPDAAAAAAAE